METHEYIRELIPAYGLDCLDPAEAEIVARHLVSCDACRAELASYRELVGQLGLGVQEYSPSPELKQKILSAVHSAPALNGIKELPKHEPKPERSSQKPAGISRFAELFRLVVPAWSVLSVLLISVLSISNVRLNQRVDSLEQAATGFQTVMLSGTDTSPSSTGLLVISPDGQNGSLVVDQMPALEDNQDFQLWLIKDGERTSGGVFHTYSNGYGVLWIHAEQPLISYDEIGLTIEPSGGSATPTGDKIMGGAIH